VVPGRAPVGQHYERDDYGEHCGDLVERDPPLRGADQESECGKRDEQPGRLRVFVQQRYEQSRMLDCQVVKASMVAGRDEGKIVEHPTVTCEVDGDHAEAGRGRVRREKCRKRSARSFEQPDRDGDRRPERAELRQECEPAESTGQCDRARIMTPGDGDHRRKLHDQRDGIADVCQACLEDWAGRKDDPRHSERLRTAAPNAPKPKVDERKQCGGGDRDDDLRRHEELARDLRHACVEEKLEGRVPRSAEALAVKERRVQRPVRRVRRQAAPRSNGSIAVVDARERDQEPGAQHEHRKGDAGQAQPALGTRHRHSDPRVVPFACQTPSLCTARGQH
jgi:hypothetical protein